jgi:hypothetical protein
MNSKPDIQNQERKEKLEAMIFKDMRMQRLEPNLLGK